MKRFDRDWIDEHAPDTTAVRDFDQGADQRRFQTLTISVKKTTDDGNGGGGHPFIQGLLKELPNEARTGRALIVWSGSKPPR